MAAWQEEGELHGPAEVCHRRLFMALPAEFEVTQNLGYFWVAIFLFIKMSEDKDLDVPRVQIKHGSPDLRI